MSVERPWEEPFQRLIEQLKTNWTEVPKKETASPVEKNPMPAGRWCSYPFFRAMRGDDQVVLTISESPVGTGDMLDAADNYEFLMLSVYRPLEARLTLRHEGIFDRLKKSIKFEWEYQTGNKEFDRKYYIVDARTDRDKALASNAEFQEQVRKLEPLTSIALMSSGVHLSVAIEDESVLSFESVDDYLGRLIRLADLAGRHSS